MDEGFLRGVRSYPRKSVGFELKYPRKSVMIAGLYHRKSVLLHKVKRMPISAMFYTEFYYSFHCIQNESIIFVAK